MYREKRGDLEEKISVIIIGKEGMMMMTFTLSVITQAYEWGVEAMKLASKLKLDQQPCCPFSVATHLLSQVDQFLADHSSQTAILEDLNILARKLDNPKLFDQCKVC